MSATRVIQQLQWTLGKWLPGRGVDHGSARLTLKAVVASDGDNQPSTAPGDRGARDRAGSQRRLDAAHLQDPFAVHDWPQMSLANDRQQHHRAASRLARVTTVAMPPLGWLVSQLGIGRVLGPMLDLLFDRHDPASSGIHVYVHLPTGSCPDAVVGAYSLVDDAFTFHHAPRAALQTHTGSRVELLLEVDPQAGVAVVVTGDFRPPDIDVIKGIFDDAVAAWPNYLSEFWDMIWSELRVAERAHELVAHGVHRLLPAVHRARVVAAIKDGVCSDSQQNAILQVLEASIRLGDIAEVIAHLGGEAAVRRELLWTMEGARDVEMSQLLERMELAH